MKFKIDHGEPGKIYDAPVDVEYKNDWNYAEWCAGYYAAMWQMWEWPRVLTMVNDDGSDGKSYNILQDFYGGLSAREVGK